MAEEVMLEANKRMSESLLWKLQHEAYTQFGVDAWSRQGVPFYITSNPYTAKQYAHVFLGYLRDCLDSLDLTQPIYLLDLGAGTGRFAYLFLKELLYFLKELNLKITLCYVLTDIVPANLAFWEQHPKFQPFFEQGILDYAYYHHGQDTPIQLLRTKKVLSKETVINPLILIANYFFDTIPQDLFRVEKGHLEEGWISLAVEGSSRDGPSVINKLKPRYSYAPLTEIKEYYPAFLNVNSILETYRKTFEGSSFLFPIGAFQSLHYFAALSKGRLLLLAGDQGVCTPHQIRQWGEPQIALHGTFSISVSYHALALYFESQKGVGLLTSFPDPAFVVMAGMLGQGNDFPETKGAFNRHLNAFEPVDYWKLVTYIQENAQMEELLLVLQMGNWDPMNLNAFFPKIRHQLPLATQSQKERLGQTIEKVWENFYPITPEEGDFVLNLGVLFFEMGHYEEALLYFERSLMMTGEKPLTRQNIEACKKRLKA